MDVETTFTRSGVQVQKELGGAGNVEEETSSAARGEAGGVMGGAPGSGETESAGGGAKGCW